MSNLALLSKKVKINHVWAKCRQTIFRIEELLTNFVSLLMSICLQCKAESCDGMADIDHYTPISDIILVVGLSNHSLINNTHSSGCMFYFTCFHFHAFLASQLTTVSLDKLKAL